MRCELRVCRRKKTALHDDEEGVLVSIRRQIVAKHALLERLIEEQVASFAKVLEHASNFPEASGVQVDSLTIVCVFVLFVRGHAALSVDNVHTSAQESEYRVGPAGGRDAALAMAWLQLHEADLKGSPTLDDTTMAGLRRAVNAIRCEVDWLSKAALAAKVMAHVSSSTQKKLLNLWCVLGLKSLSALLLMFHPASCLIPDCLEQPRLVAHISSPHPLQGQPGQLRASWGGRLRGRARGGPACAALQAEAGSALRECRIRHCFARAPRPSDACR